MERCTTSDLKLTMNIRIVPLRLGEEDVCSCRVSLVHVRSSELFKKAKNIGSDLFFPSSQALGRINIKNKYKE